MKEENLKLKSLLNQITRDYATLQTQLVLAMREHHQVNSHWITLIPVINCLKMD